MEPMDLDDDSFGHTPHPAFPPRHTPQKIYPVSHTAPPFSPFNPHTASAMSGFSPARTYVTSTPQRSASVTYNNSESSPYRRSASLHGWQSDSFTTPVSPQKCGRKLSSVASVDSPRGRGTSTPEERSLASMETSDPSDLSEMEVVQNSPSPSWERVRSALGNFSLFASKEREGDSVAGIVPEEEAGGEKMTAENVRTPWEPALSTVQAAASFKRGKGRKSPSESPVYQTRWPESETAVTKAQTEEVKALAANRLPSSGELGRKTKGRCRCCSCGLCVLSLLAVVAAVMCGVLLQRQVHMQRANFARVDTELLRSEMASKVFGQHIAVEMVSQSLKHYLDTLHQQKQSNQEDSCSLPPLVLSFHGWPGVGKNFVSDIITDLFPVKNVVKLLICHHFPHRHLDQVYQSEVQNWILSNVTNYAVNFFILDEMDKAKPGVVQGIHDAMTKLRQENSCRSPIVFLLLSNSFQADINRRVFEARENGEERDQLTIHHFSSMYSVSGNKESWHQQLQSDVSANVPFLPLEKEHVVRCIRQNLVLKMLPPDSNLVDRVLQELSFTKLPSGHEFSQTGCKRVSEKVDLVAFDD